MTTTTHTTGLGSPVDLIPHAPDRRRALCAVIGAGLVFDAAAHADGPGVAAALFLVVVSLGAVVATNTVDREATMVATASALFGALLAVRASPFLVLLDLVAWAGLLALAATGPMRRGLSGADLVARAVDTVAHSLDGLRILNGLLPRDTHRASAVLRGLIVAAPVAVVLLLLLASGDAVFASLVLRGLDPSGLLLHAVPISLAGCGMSVVLGIAGREPLAPREPRRWLGPVETSTVLVTLVAIYATFCTSQVVAISQGGRHVLATRGLTYADYARAGFFQLLFAAAITLAALALVRPTVTATGSGRLHRLVLSQAAIVLTIISVGVAVRRLGLYEAAYGATMLRLLSTVTAWWIGFLFLVLAAVMAGAWRGRAVLLPAVLASGLVVLLGLNLANPEAVVVGRNVGRATEARPIDVAYAARLSDDAVPALVAALPRLDPFSREALAATICNRPRTSGWAAATWARARAETARTDLCGRSA